ncbi:MAG: class I SAM-dependent methyltransferase [Pseudomonadota bacterium]
MISELKLPNTSGKIEVACDLCGSKESSVVFEKEGFRHVRCKKCGLVYVNPRLKGHLDFQRISGTGSMGEDRISSAQMSRICRELAIFGNYRRLNKILEIGAGRGWFLSVAMDLGWKTWAVEINRDAIANLVQKGIKNIIVSSAENFEAGKETFDAIRVWDVIEHLESPLQCLHRVYDCLRPGGLLRLSTTNFNSLSRFVNGPEWVYLNGSDHIILFDPVTITKLLKAAGFLRISLRTRSFNLRKKLYHPEREIKNRFHPLAPFRKFIDEMARFSRLGHQMIVEAVKDY